MADQNTWTIKSTLDWCEGYLRRKGDGNPLLSAQWLMSEATGLSRIQLYANFDRPLTMEERDLLRGFVARRGKGEPLQYITGEVGFRYITVKVRPGVLIPRPETEVLVSEALALLPPQERRVARDSLLSREKGMRWAKPPLQLSIRFQRKARPCPCWWPTSAPAAAASPAPWPRSARTCG